MNYTNKEKKKIYEKVIKLIEQHHTFGICFWLSRITSCYGESSLRAFFPELYQEKLNALYDKYYWFPLTLEGDKERIKLLKKIIKKL